MSSRPLHPPDDAAQQASGALPPPRRSRWEVDSSGDEGCPAGRNLPDENKRKRKRGVPESTTSTRAPAADPVRARSSSLPPSVVAPATEGSCAASGVATPGDPCRDATPTAADDSLTPPAARIPGTPLTTPPASHGTRTEDAGAGQTAVDARTARLSSPTPPPANPYPFITGCRSVELYEKLNRIEEGAYGVVYRATELATGDIVALKKLKMENEKNGFPITSLREIHTLFLVAGHPNIVNVREVVVGSKLNSVYIVMDFIEHDLKGLLSTMRSPFLQSEVKTLMLQLLSACACLHLNWIVHRDLKTSNLLLNNRGEIKVADFGLTRKYGSPLGHMTQLVVTLWYRAPELLLGAKEYSTEVDMWSVGCIFAELIDREPLIRGKSEIDQLDKIFRLLGTPNERIWPGFSQLPNAQNVNFPNHPYNTLRGRFPYLTEAGLDLLTRLLTYDPKQRITAEQALKHPYFSEAPLPKDPSLFPTWPSKGSGEKRKTYHSPSAPQAVHAATGEGSEEDLYSLFGAASEQVPGGGGAGFRLKLGM